MGSPQTPSASQYAALQAASALSTARQSSTVTVSGGSATLSISLPRQAVTLVELAW